MVNLLLALALVTSAAEPAASTDYLSRSEQILENPESVISPEDVAAWKARGSSLAPEKRKALEALAAEGHAIGEGAITEQQDAQAPANPQDTKPTFRLFVSTGMPEGTLAGAMDLARRNASVALVFRGVAPGETINQFVARLAKLPTDPESEGREPDMQFDPPRFLTDNITRVPVLVRYDKDGNAIARSEGLFNPDWLEREIAAGRTGDLGAHGPTYAITEEDMAERMKAIARTMDWSKLRDRAMAHAWAKVPVVDLPNAKRARTRKLDPTITATQTIIAPDGRTVFRKGDKVNSLDLAPFHTRLIVFDATQADQVQFAIKAAEGAPHDDVMFLFTRLAEHPSWEALAGLSETLGRAPFRLTEAVKDSFGIEVVPSVVEAEGNVFMIREQPTVKPAKAKATKNANPDAP